MTAYLIKKIGENKGAPRVWLEGKYLTYYGFLPGKKYDIDVNGTTLRLTLREDGMRVISLKERNSSQVPVIDINNRELLSVFQGLRAIRVILRENAIYILPLASEVRKKERIERVLQKLKQGDPLVCNSISHGGGVLSRALHEGLKEEGLAAECGCAVEIREELLEQSLSQNPFWTERSRFVAAPLQEFAFDEWAQSQQQTADIVEAGLPCSGASRAGRSKNKISMPEEHPDVGHLLVGALRLVAKWNPLILVVENVAEYSASASAAILRNQLRDFGYRVEERILNGANFNELEHRKRWCLLAVTEGIQFSFDELEMPEKRERHLREILDEVSEDDPRWSEYGYLAKKWERDAAAGKNFAPQLFTPADTRIGTITKGYQKVRSTDPMVAHPSNSNLKRLLTPQEHARAKGIPEDITEGLCLTTAHELLGQSICYAPFKAIGRLIARVLKRFKQVGGAVAVESLGDLFGCAA